MQTRGEHWALPEPLVGCRRRTLSMTTECGVAAEPPPPPAVDLQDLAQWLWGISTSWVAGKCLMGSVPQLSGVSVSPSLGLMSLLPLQGYHRSNHFIATQGEPRPALSANASSAPDVAARFCSWWG